MKIIKTSSVQKQANQWYNKPSTYTTKDTHEATVERGDKEIEVIITYDFLPGEPQTRDSEGWPSEVDIYKVVDRVGNPIETSESENEVFRNEIMTSLEEYHMPPEPEDEIY